MTEFFISHINFIHFQLRRNWDLAKPTLRMYKNQVSLQDKAPNSTI